MMTAIPDRLDRFNRPEFRLRNGPGEGVNGHMDVCAMQAVAWLAGEPNTDHPECACPVIARFVIRLNDSRLFAADRDLLKPYCPRIVGTRSTLDVQRRRAFIAADYAVRSFAPTILRALKRDEWAARLEAVPSIADSDMARAARDEAREIRRDAAAAVDAAADAAAAAAAAAAAYAAADAAAYAAADAAAAAAAYAAAAADAAAAAAADADAAAAADAAAYAAAAAAAAAAADADAAPILRTKALECLDAMLAVA